MIGMEAEGLKELVGVGVQTGGDVQLPPIRNSQVLRLDQVPQDAENVI